MANQYGPSYEFNGRIISRGNISFTIDEIIKYYITENHSSIETAEYFKITQAQLTRFLKHYNIKKPKVLSYEHNKKTNLKLYGNENYNNLKQAQKTCLKKYGAKNPFQVDEFKDKAVDTKITRYNDPHYVNPDQAKKTCLEKYGVSNSSMLPEVLSKRRATCKKHYGVEYPMQAKEVRAKYNFEELSSKAFETKKKNGTTNSSKIQKWFTSELQQIYGYSDVETEYNSDARYPYHCDIYIKSLDQFIELNIFFTHGGHSYGTNPLEDKKLLEKWTKLSSTSKFYKNAIRIWTETDIEKQLCAKRNNLNYLVFYTEAEVKEYLAKLKEKLC